jgi:hypothetical protein
VPASVGGIEAVLYYRHATRHPASRSNLGDFLLTLETFVGENRKMVEGRLRYHINGKFKKCPEFNCLMSSADSSWSGLNRWKSGRVIFLDRGYQLDDVGFDDVGVDVKAYSPGWSLTVC